MESVHPKRALLSFLIALAVYLLPLGLEQDAHNMLFVMVFVALLWVTECMPLHATAIFAALLMIIFVGLKPSEIFAQYFDPVIVLMLGGFVIAVAMSKHKLDEYIAYKIVSRAGNNPKIIILSLMATATFISMWISNSATAAIVMPIALVVLAKNRASIGKSNFGKASVLAVGYGATIGGIGTIIGSTPNVIAAKFLQSSGVHFGFYEWFVRGFPFMVFLMFLGWLVLITLFKPEKNRVETIKHKSKITREQIKVLIIFMLTIVLWITEPIHGIANSVVAVIPIVLFYFLGILNTEDFLKVDWPTLILLGGGIALGFGIHATGLDSVIASLIGIAALGQGLFVLFILLGVFGVILTVLISNTTAAAVYLPIVVALASSMGAGTINVVVAAAIGVSLDFIFPFGTPPTAIAYGTKYVRQKDIAKAGILISFIGIVLLAVMAMFW